MLMWVMSDRGIPRSYRMMQGFGVHTFRFVNECGVASLREVPLEALLGTHSHVWDEAVAISGCDPDYHRRDLWDAIEAGEYPEWELGVQVFTEEQADCVELRRAGRDQAGARGAGARHAHRPHGAEPQPRQLLRRDRAGGVLHGARDPGHRLHQRPAAGRAHPLLRGHAALAAGRAQLPRAAHQRAARARAQQPARRPAPPGDPARPRGLRAELAGRGCPFQTGKPGFVPFPEPMEQDELRGKPERFAEHYQQASSSSTARPRWSRRTSSRRFASS
jgi:catalase